MKRFSRFSLISLSFLLFLTLFAVTVYAQNYDISNAFGEVAKIINQFAKAFRSTAVIEGFVRFAFWVFIFAGLSLINASEKVKDNKTAKRVVNVLAAIIATYGAFRVPSKLIVSLFNIPYAFLVVFFGLITPILGFIINKKVFPDEEKRSHRFGRAVVYILIVLLMLSIIDIIQKNAGADAALFLRMMWPLRIGTAIALLFGLANLAMALGGDKVVNAARERLGLGGGAGTTAAGAGGGAAGAGGAAHAPPPPNPAEITKLQNEIGNFVTAIGNPTTPPPGPAGAGLFAVLEGAITKYNAEIHGAANDAARRAAAPTHMAALNTLQTEMANQRKRMGDILHNDQYVNCGEPYRRAFEGAIAQFLRIEHDFTQVFYQTIRWL